MYGLPSQSQIQLPLLRLCADGIVRQRHEMVKPMAQYFALDEEALAISYPNTPQIRVFADRVGWALSFLKKVGLLDKPRRGHYVISDLGRAKLQCRDDEIMAFIAESTRQPVDTTIPKKIESISETNVESPQDHLYEAYVALRQSVEEELLETILQKTPQEFEKLVVQLLQKMGYGGSPEDAIATGRPHDGGIDGEIREDVLGFGKIYIQAKRYAPEQTISSGDIQKFVGALLGHGKGVFITTSRFSLDARKYAQKINGNGTQVVLIDGTLLSKYCYDYDLGMSISETLHIKHLDSDYWDSLQNNPATEEGE